MTRAEFLAIRPNATEAQIRANISHPDTPPRPLPQAQGRPRRAKVTQVGTQAGGQAPRPKKRGGRQVDRTRNGGTWTEARFWQQVRSALRRGFRFWKPLQDALAAARIASPGPHGAKWAFRCQECTRYFRRKEIEVDHREPCGRLLGPEDLAEFLRRLTPEGTGAFRVLCVKCHREKTDREAAAKKILAP